MKKNILPLFSTPSARFSAYVTMFVAILVLTKHLHLLFVHTRSDSFIALFLATLAAFIVTGTIFISERNVLSRITSFSVMLLLATITLTFGRVYISDPLLLALMLGVSYLGSQSLLHKKPSTRRRTILYGTGIITAALVLAFSFLFTVDIVFHIAVQSHL